MLRKHRLHWGHSSFFLSADIMAITVPTITTHTTAKIAIITVPFPHETKGNINFEVILSGFIGQILCHFYHGIAYQRYRTPKVYMDSKAKYDNDHIALKKYKLPLQIAQMDVN